MEPAPQNAAISRMPGHGKAAPRNAGGSNASRAGKHRNDDAAIDAVRDPTGGPLGGDSAEGNGAVEFGGGAEAGAGAVG